MAMPYKDIKLGDMFSNPVHRGYGNFSGLLFYVIDKNDEEKMVLIQAMSFDGTRLVNEPFWKGYKDRMFSLSWKI